MMMMHVVEVVVVVLAVVLVFCFLSTSLPCRFQFYLVVSGPWFRPPLRRSRIRQAIKIKRSSSSPSSSTTTSSSPPPPPRPQPPVLLRLYHTPHSRTAPCLQRHTFHRPQPFTPSICISIFILVPKAKRHFIIRFINAQPPVAHLAQQQRRQPSRQNALLGTGFTGTRRVLLE
jgi:hypothetical protein